MSQDGGVDLDAVIEEASEAPAVETGDIEEASFTINRYDVADGEVMEREEETDVTEEEVNAIREEIQSSVESAVEAYDGGVEDGDQSIPDQADGTSEGDSQPDEDAAAGDAVADAREVVGEEGITSTDYMTYQAAMRERGHDSDTTSDAWHELREQGEIPGGDGSSSGSSSSDGGDDTGDGGEEMADVDAVYMITTTGCAGCEMAKDHMSEYIEDDLIEPINLQESGKAADIAMELGITAAPTMVVEEDGEYRKLLDD